MESAYIYARQSLNVSFINGENRFNSNWNSTEYIQSVNEILISAKVSACFKNTQNGSSVISSLINDRARVDSKNIVLNEFLSNENGMHWKYNE